MTGEDKSSNGYRSVKIREIQESVVEDFRAMCRANGWEMGEVLEVLMMRAVEREESVAFGVHALRVRRKNGTKWARRYGNG